VAQAWVKAVTTAYDTAFATKQTMLSQSDGQLSSDITSTQAAIVAGTTKCGLPPATPCATATQLAALQAKLTADLQEQTTLRNEITLIEVRQAQIVRIAYVAIQADADTTASQPDVLKLYAIGGGIGLVVGMLLAMGLLRRPIRRWLEWTTDARWRNAA
jgi:hypothetical protein